MKNIEKYFPEQYANRRPFANRMIKAFNNSDFDNDIESIHELREFIRQPIDDWHEGAYLPDEILDERDDIWSRLHKNSYELPENPTKEECKKWTEDQTNLIKSEVWKEWSNWLSKIQDLIIVHNKLELEVIIAKEYIRFCQNGRIIYDISPYVIELVQKTEIGNVKFRDFILPCKTVYFHFGTLENFEYPFDYYEEKLDIRLADSYNFKSIEEDEEFYKNKKFLLDGAFVSIVWDYAIEIQLCFKDPNDNFSKTISIVDDHRFPCFEFTLDFSHLDRVDNKIKCDKEMTFNQSTVVFCDIWDEETNPGEIKYEKLNKLTIEPEKCYISEWTEYVLMDKALKLIVNCARYLSPNEKNIKNFVTNQHTTNILKI